MLLALLEYVRNQWWKLVTTDGSAVVSSVDLFVIQSCLDVCSRKTLELTAPWHFGGRTLTLNYRGCLDFLVCQETDKRHRTASIHCCIWNSWLSLSPGWSSLSLLNVSMIRIMTREGVYQDCRVDNYIWGMQHSCFKHTTMILRRVCRAKIPTKLQSMHCCFALYAPLQKYIKMSLCLLIGSFLQIFCKCIVFSPLL